MRYLLMLTVVLAIPSVSYGEDHPNYIRVIGTFEEETDSRDYSKEQVLKANFQAAVDANSQAGYLARAFGVEIDGFYSIEVRDREQKAITETRYIKCGTRKEWKRVTKIVHTTRIDIEFKVKERPWWLQNNPAVEAPKPPWITGKLIGEGKDDGLVPEPQIIP